MSEFGHKMLSNLINVWGEKKRQIKANLSLLTVILRGIMHFSGGLSGMQSSALRAWFTWKGASVTAGCDSRPGRPGRPSSLRHALSVPALHVCFGSEATLPGTGSLLQRESTVLSAIN